MDSAKLPEKPQTSRTRSASTSSGARRQRVSTRQPRPERTTTAEPLEGASQSNEPSSPTPAKKKQEKAPAGKKAMEMTRPRQPVDPSVAETQVDIWKGVKTEASLKGEQDATCMSDFIYDKHEGKGALKYQPIKCSNVNPNSEAIADVLKHRRPPLKYTLKIYLPAHAPGDDKRRKALVTLDTGLRLGVKTPSGFVIDQLIWAHREDDRIKFLLVPDCEAGQYKTALGEHLGKLGVGLVGWDNEIVAEGRDGAAASSSGSSGSGSGDGEPVTWVYGFGASRRAAQLLIEALSQAELKEAIRDDRMVMIDGNVKHSAGVIDGYETDNEDAYDIGDKHDVTTSSGWGSGTPKFSVEGKRIKGQGDRRDGEGGTLEQVVTVGFGLPYDVAFVGGGEDVDLTDRSLQVLNLDRDGAKRKMCSLRADNTIEKIDLGQETLTVYRQKLDRYKQRLADYEGKTLTLAYRPWAQNAAGGDPVKYGYLATFAQYVAAWNGKKPEDISCLMVEIILRKAREQRKTKWTDASASQAATVLPADAHAPSFLHRPETRRPIVRRTSGKITISRMKPKKGAKAGQDPQDPQDAPQDEAPRRARGRRTNASPRGGTKRAHASGPTDDSSGESAQRQPKKPKHAAPSGSTGRRIRTNVRRDAPAASSSTSAAGSPSSPPPPPPPVRGGRPQGDEKKKRKRGSSASDSGSASGRSARKKAKNAQSTGQAPQPGGQRTNRR